jgi:hypothetical protein
MRQYQGLSLTEHVKYKTETWTQDHIHASDSTVGTSLQPENNYIFCIADNMNFIKMVSKLFAGAW